MFRPQIGQISRAELPLALISHRERWGSVLTRDDRRGCSVPFSRSQSQSTPLSRSSFLGVPTKVSFSSFLSLIRLRLLSDPKHTNSTYSEGGRDTSTFKTLLFDQSLRTCQTGADAQHLRKRTKGTKTWRLEKPAKKKKTRSFRRKIDKFERYRDAPWCLELLMNQK